MLEELYRFIKAILGRGGEKRGGRRESGLYTYMGWTVLLRWGKYLLASLTQEKKVCC